MKSETRRLESEVGSLTQIRLRTSDFTLSDVHDPQDARVNVPPERVESEKPMAAVPPTTMRAAVAEPRNPIRTVPVWRAPCLWTALSFAASTLTVTDRFVKSKSPESAWPLI